MQIIISYCIYSRYKIGQNKNNRQFGGEISLIENKWLSIVSSSPINSTNDTMKMELL